MRARSPQAPRVGRTVTAVLTVCTGNICRSPAAELLLASYLGDLAHLSSAGTHAELGWGIPQPMLTCLERDNIDGAAHRATQLTEGGMAAADLVIVMTRQHRSWALREAPSAMKKTFLLEELAAAARARLDLPGDDPATRLANVATVVDAARGRGALVGQDGESPGDVPDPYGRGQRVYDETYAMIRDAVDDFNDWVRG